MSATVMYLTRQAKPYTLIARQSVTALYHGAEALATDPVVCIACGMRCHLQTYPGFSELSLSSKEGWFR